MSINRDCAAIRAHEADNDAHLAREAKAEIADLLYLLGNVREFVETEMNNRICAGGDDSDYCNEARRALVDILAVISIAAGKQCQP
jgi:hypothetical protein